MHFFTYRSQKKFIFTMVRLQVNRYQDLVQIRVFFGESRVPSENVMVRIYRNWIFCRTAQLSSKHFDITMIILWLFDKNYIYVEILMKSLG